MMRSGVRFAALTASNAEPVTHSGFGKGVPTAFGVTERHPDPVVVTILHQGLADPLDEEGGQVAELRVDDPAARRLFDHVDADLQAQPELPPDGLGDPLGTQGVENVQGGGGGAAGGPSIFYYTYYSWYGGGSGAGGCSARRDTR